MTDYALGTTLYPKFSTAVSAVGTSLLGAPAVAAYANGSLTEITAGITLTVDFDGRTGLNEVAVVATSGNGYAEGVDYSLVVTQGTVGGVNVAGTVVEMFSLAKASALRPVTAGRTLAVGADGSVGITSHVKKNQALANFLFPMSASTDHNPATGKTVTCTRSIDGGAFAAGTLANVAEVGFGVYRVDWAAADLNGNNVVLRATASGCDDYLERLVTQP